MRKKNEEMIILKSVCDVPDQQGRMLFGRLICGSPAIAIGKILVSVAYGKEYFHVCMRHAGLPLDQLLKIVYKDQEIGLADDAQR